MNILDRFKPLLFFSYYWCLTPEFYWIRLYGVTMAHYEGWSPSTKVVSNLSEQDLKICFILKLTRGITQANTHQVNKR